MSYPARAEGLVNRITGITTPGCSGPVSKDNEGVLHIPQIWGLEPHNQIQFSVILQKKKQTYGHSNLYIKRDLQFLKDGNSVQYFKEKRIEIYNMKFIRFFIPLAIYKVYRCRFVGFSKVKTNRPLMKRLVKEGQYIYIYIYIGTGYSNRVSQSQSRRGVWSQLPLIGAELGDEENNESLIRLREETNSIHVIFIFSFFV